VSNWFEKYGIDKNDAEAFNKFVNTLTSFGLVKYMHMENDYFANYYGDDLECCNAFYERYSVFVNPIKGQYSEYFIVRWHDE